MMKIIIAIVFLSFLVVLVGNTQAVNGLGMMKIENGARQAGMGTAVVSLTDDPNGVAYNPASIVGIKGFEASFGHTAYWDNIRLESGYYAISLSQRTFLHGGIRYAVVDNLEERLIPSAEPISYFDAHDVSFKSGLSYKVRDNFTVGASIGWFIEKIEAWRGSVFNADLGLLFNLTSEVNIGASITNIGGDVNLSKPNIAGSRDISLPTRYTIGASYRYQKYLGAMDIVVFDDDVHLNMGGEVQVNELFKVRTGYMFNYDSKNFTAGASFTKRNLTIDYAFVPFTNDLGTSHIFNLTFNL